MSKEKKTNAMRLLDKEKIEYQMITYESNDGKIDGVSVAQKIKKDPKLVYKTLVAKGLKTDLYVFIVPVEEELDLKKAAKAVAEKKVELIPVKDITKHTGYIRGGCSPIGMKKLYQTVIDEKAEDIPYIIVSGGRIGLQMELILADLLQITKGQLAPLT